jgi:hypothetical protein
MPAIACAVSIRHTKMDVATIRRERPHAGYDLERAFKFFDGVLSGVQL